MGTSSDDPGAPYPTRMPESQVKFEPPLFVGLEPEDGEERLGALPPGAGGQTQLDDMVNSMLPPREWTEETGTWMQYVSKKPATRQDVISLQEDLDKKLATRQAREGGICPVREDLYSQTFEELIRQVTLDGPDRGLLLMRVRDEIRMCMDAYRTLYESSETFGIKKLLQAEVGMEEMEAEIAALEGGNTEVDYRISQLRAKLDLTEKRNAELRALEEKKRKEEIDYLKSQGSHLDAFMKQMGG
jgi:dynein light intermediate chain